MGEFWDTHDGTEFWGQTELVEFEVSGLMAIWKVRYYLDPETRFPHIYEHDVTEEEVEDVLFRPGDDLQGREGTRIAVGQTRAGRYLRVVYSPDAEPGSVFVITAYELRGKALSAYRRRRGKR